MKLEQHFEIGFAVVFYSILFCGWWQLAVFLLVIVITHELGHYLVARKFGLFEGVYIGLFPAIKFKHKAPRWTYLAGFLSSMLAFPFWIWLLSYPVWGFFVFAVGGSGLDFTVVLCYNKMEEAEEG